MDNLETTYAPSEAASEAVEQQRARTPRPGPAGPWHTWDKGFAAGWDIGFKAGFEAAGAEERLISQLRGKSEHQKT